MTNRPDIVWLARPGINEHLRFSIRSLTTNLSHENIHVVGHPPSWFSGRRLRPRRNRGRYGNTTISVRLACEDPEISDPFVLANDDFFLFEPVDTMPALHGGSLRAKVEHHRATQLKGEWATGGAFALDALLECGVSDPLNYDLHVPLRVHKAAMLKALDIVEAAPVKEPWKRSVYGNLARLGGVEVEDVKVRTDTSAGPDVWLSTSSVSWPGVAGARVRSAWPEPSEYERHQRVK